MVRRLIKDGHEWVVFDHLPKAVNDLVVDNVTGASSPADMIKKLAKPRKSLGHSSVALLVNSFRFGCQLSFSAVRNQ